MSEYEDYDKEEETTEAITIDKSRLKGKNGGYITQSLFLELSYDNPQYALFTLNGEDRMYKGQNMISLKALYLEMEDIVGYTFANTYLYDWQHWERMKKNKRIGTEILKWEEELDIKMRSNAVRAINEKADDGHMEAAKYIAEAKWKQRGAGRPTNLDKQNHLKLIEKVDDEFNNDVAQFKRD
jgi:hypothetical protein